jgi:integrase
VGRPRKTEVKTRQLADGSTSYWARLTVAPGDRRAITLGSSLDGMSEQEAGEELRNHEARVQLGEWIDPNPTEPSRDGVLFAKFAKRKYLSKRRELSKRGAESLRYRLELHLLPFFEPHALHEIDVALVNTYRDHKLAEREEIEERIASGERLVDEHGQPIKPLANSTINKTINTLSWLLEEAVEENLIETNAAAGKRRRLKEEEPHRTWLMPDQVLDIFDAGDRLDGRYKPVTYERAIAAQALHETLNSIPAVAREMGIGYSTTHRLVNLDLDVYTPSVRRALLAMVVLAGLRANELCELRWRDIDFVNRRIYVRGTKTRASKRHVRIVDFLRVELLRWWEDAPSTRPDARVFVTKRGTARTDDNLRTRVLAPAIAEANRVREIEGRAPIDTSVTTHSLRRTFIALMLAAKRPVPTVQREAGHTDSRTTLNIYAEVIDVDFDPTLRTLETLTAYTKSSELEGAVVPPSPVPPSPDAFQAAVGKVVKSRRRKAPGSTVVRRARTGLAGVAD